MARKKATREIEDLIERILVDCYGDEEAFVAFCVAFGEHVQWPRDGFVAGQPISVHEVDYEGNVLRGLVATCRTENGETYRIGLTDVVFPDSTEASRYLAAYRSWLGVPPPVPARSRAQRPRRHKAREEDLDLDGSIDLIVLSMKQRTARCRVPGTERVLTLRCRDAWRMAPGAIVTIRPGKQWSYAGHPYLSGELERFRVDVDVLGLVPLTLRDEDVWDPNEEYWGEEGEPIPDWAQPIVSRGRRPQFEMEQVIPGEDPEDPDEDPITRSMDLRDAGEWDEAERILMELLEEDLRCLDAHAHLGNMLFDRWPERAITHYEIGKAIGELSLGEDFDGVLHWGLIDNRPFLRCLQGYGLCAWRLGRFSEAAGIFERMLRLNPSDNQGIRFLVNDVNQAEPWDAGTAV